MGIGVTPGTYLAIYKSGEERRNPINHHPHRSKVRGRENTSECGLCHGSRNFDTENKDMYSRITAGSLAHIGKE
uniref:Uncharacterized protein n=1 Tax=Cucumis melo TaxID=3656 RepID=A0A9I9DCJ8_CUCME